MRDLEFTDNEKIEWIYDGIAGVMAIIAVIIVMLQFSNNLSPKVNSIVNIIDVVIYFIFLSDYLIRILTSKDRKRFFKHNVIDTIAIFPFMLFMESNFGSVFKLIRVVTYVLRLVGNVKEILFTNGFIYALGSTVLITFIGSLGIYVFEHGTENISDYGDALWWSFVTVTTVGYGDISPSSGAGRFIACILMITGIGFLSMLTSTISTFFFSKIDKRKENKSKEKNKVILDISDLSEEKRNNLLNYYKFLKENDI